ncbi:MAG: hypothetical protein KIT83_16110 [Bryobacterales bacterium]|nr:hypothetical protein [Bryobacterales bacterium]
MPIALHLVPSGLRASLLLAIATFLAATPGWTQTSALEEVPVPSAEATAVPPAACFPMESLHPDDRKIGEKWLLDALDKEALYTVASHLKPASLSFLAGRISVTQPTEDEISSLRRAARTLATWHCGDDLAAAVIPGAVVMDGRRVVHAVFYRKARVMAVIAEFPGVYGAAGIVPEMPPGQVLATVELLQPPLRHRAWGHLLGYPAYAVEFFATADETQRTNGDSSTKGIVPRDFISVPVFAKPTNHFVWAAPKGHQEDDFDRSIRRHAAPVLERYRKLREIHINERGEGVLALVRALLCEADHCGHLASHLEETKAPH